MEGELTRWDVLNKLSGHPYFKSWSLCGLIGFVDYLFDMGVIDNVDSYFDADDLASKYVEYKNEDEYLRCMGSVNDMERAVLKHRIVVRTTNGGIIVQMSSGYKGGVLSSDK